MEMLYKFVFAKKSYYDLVMTRQVEPQAQDDRQSEEDAQTTDTTGENRATGSNGRGEDGGRWRARTTAPPTARTQKTALADSPKTRVRV